MSDVNVVAVIKAKPGDGDKLEGALTDLGVATHGEEGCLHYSLHRGLTDTDTFVTIEKWRSLADLDSHMGAPHMKTAMSEFGDLLAAPPEIVPAGLIALGDPAKGTF